MKQEIKTGEDVKLLVNTFYDAVNQDELLAPIFNDHAKVDWESHLPVMYDFWSSILLGSTAYKGRPFPKHLRLPITTEHFGRWVELFTKTIDTHFEGVKANEAKQKAASIAQIFQMKMGFIDIKRT
jgi:hemoglobin